MKLFYSPNAGKAKVSMFDLEKAKDKILMGTEHSIKNKNNKAGTEYENYSFQHDSNYVSGPYSHSPHSQ